MKVELLLHGELVTLDIVRQGDRLRVTREGQTVEARLLFSNGTVFEIEVGSQHIMAVGSTHGAQRQLWTGGRTLRYERLIEGQALQTRGGGSLASTIPAIASRVLVRVGDHVKAGDKLVVLESMKMVINITAPHDGIVEGVHCMAGRPVEAGVPLVTLRQA